MHWKSRQYVLQKFHSSKKTPFAHINSSVIPKKPYRHVRKMSPGPFTWNLSPKGNRRESEYEGPSVMKIKKVADMEYQFPIRLGTYLGSGLRDRSGLGSRVESSSCNVC